MYAFQLGRKSELCIAELESIFGKESVVFNSRDVAILKIPAITSPQETLNALGGSIKVIEIIEKVDFKTINKSIERLLKSTFTSRLGKIPFCLTTFGLKAAYPVSIKELLNFSKKVLKSMNLNSRFVNQDFKNTKPSTIYKSRTVEKGIDINLIFTEEAHYIGKTIAMQDIDSYTKRDFDKPKKDGRVGMTPPKLAQIMINMAGKPDKIKTIYDPFCGTGTFLIEGLLNGKTAIGSDIEPRMIEYTDINCEWAKKEFRSTQTFRTFERDARFLTAENLPEEIDAVITEGYLGKAVSMLPSKQEREKTFRELANLHLNWLQAIHKLTKPDCKVVTCIAAFRTKDGIEHLPDFNDLAQEAGYRVIRQFTYDRPDQIVARDIKILEKL